MNNMRVREATEKDTKDIGVLIELLYHLGRPKSQKDSDVDILRNLVKKHITDLDKKILVAELDNEIVGMVSIMFLSRLNQTLEMYIPDLVIHEKYQSKGIGKKLMNSCISLAKEKKCYRIRLESRHHRKESHEFYKHLGFEQPALFFAKNLV